MSLVEMNKKIQLEPVELFKKIIRFVFPFLVGISELRVLKKNFIALHQIKSFVVKPFYGVFNPVVLDTLHEKKAIEHLDLRAINPSDNLLHICASNFPFLRILKLSLNFPFDVTWFLFTLAQTSPFLEEIWVHDSIAVNAMVIYCICLYFPNLKLLNASNCIGIQRAPMAPTPSTLFDLHNCSITSVDVLHLVVHNTKTGQNIQQIKNIVSQYFQNGEFFEKFQEKVFQLIKDEDPSEYFPIKANGNLGGDKSMIISRSTWHYRIFMFEGIMVTKTYYGFKGPDGKWPPAFSWTD